MWSKDDGRLRRNDSERVDFVQEAEFDFLIGSGKEERGSVIEAIGMLEKVFIRCHKMFQEQFD